MADGMWYLPGGIALILVTCFAFLIAVQIRILKKLRHELTELRWLLEQALDFHTLLEETKGGPEGPKSWSDIATTDMSREGVVNDSPEARESQGPSSEAPRDGQPAPARRLYAWAVGISKGAKGPSAIGVVVKDPLGRCVARIKDRTGPLDRRNAVYRALVETLKRAFLEGAKELVVFTNAPGGKPDLDPKASFPVQTDIRRELQELRRRFENIEWILVERPKLREAEAMAKEALLPSGGRALQEIRIAHGQPQR